MLRKSKKSEAVDSPFSRFIREASSKEKKRVYSSVISKATEDQARVIRAAQEKEGDAYHHLPGSAHC